MSDRMFNVKNRSAGMVIYNIPDKNIRREFQAGESRRVSYEELEALTFQPGGRELMRDFLQIEEEAVKEFAIHAEPEYYMSEEQVDELIKTGPMDAFLDCIEFAPRGVLDLLKTRAVALPMSDLNKIEALKQKTGFDVAKAIELSKNVEEPTPEQAAVQAATAPTGRRTSVDYKETGSKYKVVKTE